MDGAQHHRRRRRRRCAGLPKPLPLAVVVYGPRELQWLAPTPQEDRPLPHARLVAVEEVVASSPAGLPLPHPSWSGLRLPQRLAALDDDEGTAAHDDVAAVPAAREEGPSSGCESGGRDALPAAKGHQPPGQGGEEGEHGTEHGVKAGSIGCKCERATRLQAQWSECFFWITVGRRESEGYLKGKLRRSWQWFGRPFGTRHDKLWNYKG